MTRLTRLTVKTDNVFVRMIKDEQGFVWLLNFKYVWICIINQDGWHYWLTVYVYIRIVNRVD